MLRNLRVRLCALRLRFLLIPKGYFTISILLIIAAVVIRLSTGGTHIIYNALQGRGLFPGPFVYSIMYYLRLMISGIILTFLMYSCSLYGERLRPLIISVVSTFLLLLEYKLIFGGVSLVLSIAFSVLIPFLTAISVILSREKSKIISLLMLVFAVLQIVACVQTISLAVCI